jgi:leucyl aminopeptidase (aminopeptidase T)
VIERDLGGVSAPHHRISARVNRSELNEDRRMELSRIAFDNYCAYLPPKIGHWGLLYDRRVHQAIVRGLVARVADLTVLDLHRDPETVSAFAREHRDDPQVGTMAFMANQPSFDLSYSQAHNDALGEFSQWHASKMKVCFEVWDGNFESLFAERADTVQARCRDMLARVRLQRRLSYAATADAPDDLDIDCRGVTWITETGFEDYDYILPTGEVVTCPSSLDGSATLHGWLIGTLPFGSKYGQLSPGELVVRFARGRVTEVSGSNRAVCSDFEHALEAFPSLQHVSEAAVGMSRCVAATAPSHTAGHLWHERHLGFHIGLGARLAQTPHPDVPTFGQHLDLVFRHGQLRAADGSELLTW